MINLRSSRAPALLMLMVGVATTGRSVSARQAGIDLEKLRSPDPPVFVLLGASPTAVQRPTTPKALAASFMSAGGENLLPNNYALEVAPYWFVGHPNLTFDDYYAAGLGQSLLQSLSLSFGTSRVSSGDPDAVATDLAFGVRTFVVPGKASPELAGRRDALIALQDSLNRAFAGIIVLGDQAMAALEERLAAAGASIAELDKERVGLTVELAAAVMARFPDDRIDGSRIAKAGIWVTAGYRLPSSRFDVVGVVRYFRDRTAATGRDRLDTGARLILNAERLSVSAEFLEQTGDRLLSGERPGYRLSGNLEYRVRDDVYLTATLGREDGEAGDPGPQLISLFGLNVGFGKLPVIGLQ